MTTYGNGNGNGHDKCDTVPPGFIPPGLAKKCGQGEEPYPDNHPGGPRDGWEKQFKKKHWEFNYTNDVSLALPEPIQVTEADATKWKETYVYGAGGERVSMTYLPANDHDNGWDPLDGTGGAEPGVTPKTLYYLNDALGSPVALMEQDGRVSSRYNYEEFGIPDAKKFDVNWPGPDNLFGYTGLGYDYYSGLSYARARYYQPEIGRFISEDTYKGQISNPLSLNLYTYVENNPLRFTDPSGHCVACFTDDYGVREVYGYMYMNDIDIDAPVFSFTDIADFLVIDDIRTLTSSSSSDGSKALAAMSLTPWGKLLKAEKLSKLHVTIGEKGVTQGYKTFDALKKALGPAGEGKQWHHIVEQSQTGKRAYFDATDINNINNAIAIPSGKGSIHEKISAYYSSKQRFTDGKTVRDWLADKSFEYQFEFGSNVLKRYGTVKQTDSGWVFTPFKE